MEKIILAKQTTLMAAKRTLLSHIRTSLVCISLAFAFIKLDKQNPIDFITISLFVLAGVFLIAGIIDFYICKKIVQNLNKNEN